MRRLLIASLSLGLMSACNLGPKPNTDDVVDDTGGGEEDGISISDLQDGTIAEGETVTLVGVVVTSGWDGETKGFFIQDAGGGEYSGIYVYAPSVSDTYLEVGYELTITGQTTEFYDWTEFSVADTSAIEVTGSAALSVDAVDPATVTDWEIWESCLITIGAATAMDNINGYGEITLDSGLFLDNWFFDYQGEQGATWTEVTGQLIYNYEWKLAPRSEDDLAGYVPGEGPGKVSVGECQDGTVPEDSAVSIEGAVVTSPPVIDEGEIKGFFIQDAGGGSGIYVYAPNASSDDIQVGGVLDLTGTVVEFYDLTEIKDAQLDWGSTTDTVVATELSSAPSDWEPYEGHLVTLSNVEVTAEADYGEVETDWGLNIDDLFTDFPWSPALGSYSSVTGIVNYAFGAFTICPRDVADVKQ